jgi:hypothetical protein
MHQAPCADGITAADKDVDSSSLFDIRQSTITTTPSSTPPPPPLCLQPRLRASMTLP